MASPSQVADVIAPIDAGELWKAVKSLHNGKAPGPDRLPNGIYSAFFNEVKASLVTFLNGIMSGGDLPQGFTEATVRLIPKKGNSNNLADWRPISLLNNDYKIFTTLLRNRKSPIADKLISKEQIGFMNGRNINTNIWVVNKEYMEYQVS